MIDHLAHSRALAKLKVKVVEGKLIEWPGERAKDTPRELRMAGEP